MRIILLFNFLFYSFLSFSQVGTLQINEFMASNDNIKIPGYSGNDDWIEIRNTSSNAIDISGYYITDNLSNLKKVRLPIVPGSLVVPANGYVVIICSDNTSLGANHIELGLSASGEAIGLTAADGITLIDSFIFGAQKVDISMGRDPQSPNEWKYFKNPTPGSVNNVQDMYNEIIEGPTFSHPAGFYTSEFQLTISSTATGATILYTLDGSDPKPENVGGTTFLYKQFEGGPSFTESMNTYIYNSAISLNNRSNELNKVSVKSSSPIDNNVYFPNELVSKGTVVKAIAYKSGSLSEMTANTYFIFPTENKYSLPVVSVSMDEKKLFDFNNGFYTWGAKYDSSQPCAKGNYYEGWRHSGHFEYFVNNEKVIDREVVYRMHGGCSRFSARKTLRILGGSSFDYPLFNSTPERNHQNILLRNGGQNWNLNFMKDAINHDVMATLNLAKQETNPTTVFINGEYWGIQNMRERIDQHYLNVIYGVDKDNIDLIEIGGYAEASEGDMVAYNKMMSFVANNNFNNNANYDSLMNLIDIESFIDYHIAQTFIANSDWPSSNTRFWRTKTDFNPNIKGPSDGRWRWILYDTDLTTYSFVDRLNWLLYDTHFNSLIFRKLSQNTKFRQALGTRHADLLNTLFLSSRTTKIVDDYKNKMSPEIQEHSNRWKSPSLSVWNSEINDQRKFYAERPEHQRGFLMQYLGLNTQRNLTLNVSDFSKGYIKVNTINISSNTPGVSSTPYPWTGIYFQGLPITLSAHNQKGGKFRHWLKNGIIHSSTPSIRVNLNSDESYTAVFDEHILSDNPFPIAKVLDECGFQFTEWSTNAPAGSHPENMAFVYFNSTAPKSGVDHILSDTIGGFTSGKFDYTNRSRINGLNKKGVSFINTGGDAEHEGYPFGKLGGLLLALNTTGQNSIYVNWTAGTVLPNLRDYAIRLQYRVGDLVPFSDVLDENSNPIEYQRNQIAGHTKVFENIKLPEELSNKPYVQLLWNYYYKDNGTENARPQLKIDDIVISTKSIYEKGSNQVGLSSKFGKIESEATINQGEITEYTASNYILLDPGFNTEANASFKAEINRCEI